MSKNLKWYRILQNKNELLEGRVKTVSVAHNNFCLTHFEGKFHALDNKCPHQGGPLGEGSIENGMLRCPWHGWDFHPATGKPPGGYDDGIETFPIEERKDGIYIGLTSEKTKIRTVSNVMVETMVNCGIKHVFGMIGHSCLGLADAIREEEKKGNLRFFTVRHEGAAAFAASGYAKLIGKPAACLTIAGPGATNLLTGLWDAKVDRAPILALTGQVNTQVLGPGAFQDIDLSAAFSSVTRFSQPVLHSSKHAELMLLAMKKALIYRDVSHLIFPDEVQVLPAKPEDEVLDLKGRIASQNIIPPKTDIDKAVKQLQQAKRPVIICGYGAKNYKKEIKKLAETLKCPVITTFKGKGIISDKHPLGCGVLGRSGTPIASWFMNEADVLLVLGASFSDHTGITPHKPLIQVDFDLDMLGKFHPIDIPVWGEIGETLKILTPVLKQNNAISHKKEIAERWSIWRAEKEKRCLEDRGKGINSSSIFMALSKLANKDAAIAVDVGNNTYSFGRYFECQEQDVMMSGYLGSIGFGFPAAMGAWAAAGHKRQIIAVTGDGGFGQYMGEYTTAVKYNMNITHILLNNSEIGKISKEQLASQVDVWQTTLHNPNFAKYAKLCNGWGIRVTKQEELESAIQQALEHNGLSVVEIITDAHLI